MPRRTSLKTIETKIKALQAKAEALKHVEKPGIKQLKAVVAKFKLKPADIKLALTGTGARGKAASKRRGKKLKAKYRNPAKKSETWAGRGLKPKWVSAQLKQGKKLENFAV
jgi:DNA-binding protein H-NS